MSDLLNKASLVMVPSGYKEDTVYSVIPTDGSGDLSFTRASNGTRVNSAGLVEVCPWNLADQSNTFGTSPWSNVLDTGATLTYTANYGTAPDGTTTAGRLQMALNGSNYAQKNQIISVITGQQYTYSVWIKSLSGTKDVIFCYDNTNNIHATVTTEWQRFIHTFTGNSQVYARFVLEAGTSTSVDLLIYGAQLNIGSTAKPYFPTTDRLNVPRLTYQNGGGGCPSLLLEKQSTNLVSWSEDLTQSDWTKQSGISVTANQTISPDGTQNADLVVGNGSSGIFQSGKTVSTTVANTKSVYLKGVSGGEVVRLQDPNQTVGYTSCTLTTSWQRFTLSEVQSGGSAGLWVTLIPSGGIYIWGAQLEASSYATSYIPTTSSSATRVADECYKTGISSLIGQTEGTLFMDINNPNPSQYLGTPPANTIFGSINSGDYQNNFHFTTDDANIYVYCNASGGALQAAIGTTMPTTSKIKMAVTYTSSAIKFFLNGVLVGTDTGFVLPSSMSRADIGHMGGQPDSQRMRGSVNEFLLFTTALTDAEAIALTTI